MEMPSLYLFLDPYLIWFYRLTGQTGWNFLIGTSVVAVLALMVGELTSLLASLLVRRHFTQVAGEAKKYQDLSMEALKAGDRPAYEAANKLANDAFNKSFLCSWLFRRRSSGPSSLCWDGCRNDSRG